MSVTRRQMMTLIGGGTVLAAAGGAALTAATDAAATRPWTVAGTQDDPRLRALSYALLAPNPHNRQPWMARLDGKDEITLYRDEARNLPETDPYDRQLTIGMGAFIELLRMAAGEEALKATTTLFPNGSAPGQPIAHIRLTGGGAPDPLFAHVLARRTNRNPYDMARPVTATTLDDLTASDPLAGGTSDGTEVTALRQLSLDAMLAEMHSPGAHRESVNLMRIGGREIAANPDGISLSGPGIAIASTMGIVTCEKLLDKTSQAFRQGEEMQRNAFHATPAFVWIKTPGDTRHDQIAAGRSWLRLHLDATARGLALQPVSQSLQEYADMRPYYDHVHARLAPDGERVQMLGRIGYGPDTSPAPRWPLETRLIDN